MELKIPEKAEIILHTLEEAGYEAYVVGGCVRDSILGRSPDDWDITTSAKPEEVKALFRRTVDTGLIHGTVTVMLDKEGFEVTTYRVDGEYEDGRHPKEVWWIYSAAYRIWKTGLSAAWEILWNALQKMPFGSFGRSVFPPSLVFPLRGKH